MKPSRDTDIIRMIFLIAVPLLQVVFGQRRGSLLASDRTTSDTGQAGGGDAREADDDDVVVRKAEHGWVVVRPHEIVTFALPDSAPHCKGAAYDIAPLVNEIPAWHRLDLFQAVADLSIGLSLVWGGHWDRIKDLPHYELPGHREMPIKEH